MAVEFLQCAPVLLVRSVAESAAFWRDKLGFETALYHQPPTFAIVSRGQARVMLAQLPMDAEPVVPNWRIARATSQVYLWVDDCAAFYAEAQERGAPIDFTLYDTPWGTREFGTQDPNEFDITFGQVLSEPGRGSAAVTAHQATAEG